MTDGLSEGLKDLQDSLSGGTEAKEVEDAPNQVPSATGEPENAQIETADSVTDNPVGGEIPEPAPPVDAPEGWNPTDVSDPHAESPLGMDHEQPLAVAHEPLPFDHPHASDIGDWPTPDEFEKPPEANLDLAGLGQADFEEAIFPPEDDSGHDKGQKTLARVEANLKSAGYATDESWRTQIAAALWGRRTYEHGDVDDVRRRIERAPVAEVIACMPDHGDDVVSRMRAEVRAELAAEAAAAEEIRAAEGVDTGGRTGIAVITVASILAIGFPILFAKRS
jgi:hypothetical protein